jgi:hypothetical protein
MIHLLFRIYEKVLLLFGYEEKILPNELTKVELYSILSFDKKLNVTLNWSKYEMKKALNKNPNFIKLQNCILTPDIPYTSDNKEKMLEKIQSIEPEYNEVLYINIHQKCTELMKKELFERRLRLIKIYNEYIKYTGNLDRYIACINSFFGEDFLLKKN